MDVLLCILANVWIFLAFRLFSKFHVHTFGAIVINYLVCVITGVIFIGFHDAIAPVIDGPPWLIWALLVGGVFIGTFYLMARTTQEFSMTVASIATKMSLVIPVLFSLLVLGTRSRDYTIFNYTGIALALVAILLTSLRKRRKGKAVAARPRYFWLPILVFLLGGFIDTTLNAVNQRYLRPADEGVFPIVIFLTAGVIGGMLLISRRTPLSRKEVLGGIFLGVVNYFSVYFLLAALHSFNNDGAFIYPLVNVGIILGSALFSIVLFRERLTLTNLSGLFLAILAIFLLSHQEVLSLF